MTDTAVQQQKHQQLIAKYWSDEAFKRRLLTAPLATLRDEGWVIPEGITIHACEDTDRIRHLVIPAMAADLTDEQLDRIAGGSQWSEIARIEREQDKALQQAVASMTDAEMDSMMAKIESM